MNEMSLLEELKSIAFSNFGLKPEEISLETGILELGLDSLMIIKLGREIERRFGLSIPARWFFANRPSLRELAVYLAEHIPQSSPAPGSPEKNPELASKPAYDSDLKSAETGIQPSSAGSSVLGPRKDAEGAAKFSPDRNRAGRQAAARFPEPCRSPKPPQSSQAYDGPAGPSGASSDSGGGLTADRLALFKLQMEAMNELFAAQWRGLAEAPVRRAAGDDQAGSSNAGDLRGGHSCIKKEEFPQSPKPASVSRNFRGFVLEEEPLSDEQLAFIRALTERHLKRTRKSRELHQASQALADWKSSLHYRQILGQLAYPIAAHRTYRGRFTDVDGNDYLDVALGMGVNFLGHNPEYINQAVRGRLERGYGLGPQCDLTGPVASGIAKLTGLERVCFCNTGSEAVMFSLRLARARTKRPLIAIFNGSYHGTYDGILAEDDHGRTVTYSPGTRPGMVEDVLVLNYGSDEALEAIKENAGRLAAVLVEPVQSRKPALQPQSFLRRLRKLTEEFGIALIFDEMINGFRIAPGGAQEFFGVRADMALYGKLIGGGLPIGVVAGAAKWLDGIDGGRREYGSPSPEVIVFGGTFCRHPLSLAASKAVIEHLLEQGPKLQGRVAKMADDLAASLNLWFQDSQVPLRLFNFGPQFIFEGYGPWSALVNPLELDLFYLLLLEKGVYVWERRTCSLSAAHTAEELDFFAAKVREAVTEIRDRGFEFGPDLAYGAPKLLRPMNYIQKRFYAIFQSPNGQDPYHLTVGFRLTGQVRPDLLEIALGRLIEINEALRSDFRHIGSDLVCYAKPWVPFHLIQEKTDPNTPLKSLVGRLTEPYNLQQAPLFRAGLFDRGEDFIFILDASHLMIDGAGLGLMLGQLNQLMNGESLSQTVKLAEVEEDLNHYLGKPDKTAGNKGPSEADLSYWSEKLQGLEPLAWPLDFPAKSGSKTGCQKWFEVSAQQLQSYRQTARKFGLTLNMLLSGLYVLTLHRFTGSLRLCVALAHSGRFTEKSEEAIGLFVTTVPQDFQVDPQAGLEAFFNGIKFSALEALEHPHAPYESLSKRLGFSPAQSMLSYEKGGFRCPEWPGVEARPLALPANGAMYDLSLDIVEMNDGLKINLIHSEAFRGETAEIIGQYYLDLARTVTALTAGPLCEDLTVSEVLAQSDIWEKKTGQFLFNDQKTPADFDVIESLAESARKFPLRLAVAVSDQSWNNLTYAELNLAVSNLASNLMIRGLGPGPPVAVCLPRIPLYAVTILGLLKAGLTFLPLPLPCPPRRLNLILADSGARYLLALDKPADLPAEVQWLDPGALADLPVTTVASSPGSPSLPAQKTSAPDDLAYIIYTSGSTGQPKGVMIERRGLHNLLAWYLKEFKLTENDRVSSFAPFSFDASIWEIFPPLMVGAELHILSEEERRNGPRLWQFLKDRRITVCYLLSQVAELLPGESLPDLRILLSGGDRLHLKEPRGSYLHYNTYGPTEFTVTSHFFRLNGTSPVPIGKPVAQSQGLILDGDGRLCPPGRPGELCLSGPQLARGYAGREDLTAKVFGPNPFPPKDAHGQAVEGFARMYRTGDLCRLLPSGDIEFLGRLDRQLKIRGHRIEPGEIEGAILQHPNVTEALVVKSSGPGEKLWAYVAPETVDVSGLRSFLAEILPDYLVPEGLTPLARLPLSQTGKIDAAALPDQTGRNESFEPPQGPEEAVLAAVLGEALNLPEISRTANYFALGGDSVGVISVTSKLRARGYSLTASDFYQSAGLADLARKLKKRGLSDLTGRTGLAGLSEPAPEGGPGTGESRFGGDFLKSSGPSRASAEISSRPEEPAEASVGGGFRESPVDFPVYPADSVSKEVKDEIARFYQGDVAAVWPLSPLQRSILSQMALSGSGADKETYIEQTHLRLPDSSSFAPDLLRSRLERLLQTADIFRFSVYRSSPEAPVQVQRRTIPDLAEVYSEFDLSDLSDRGIQEKIVTFRNEHFQRLSNISSGPLLALTLIKNNQAGFDLLASTHHLMSDAWSEGLFFASLFGSGRAPSAGFAGYLKAVSLNDQEPDRIFWRDFLKDLNEITELPGYRRPLTPGLTGRAVNPGESDNLAPAQVSGRSGENLKTLSFPLNLQQSNDIRKAGRWLQAAPALFLEAAWAVIAARAARVSQVSYAVIDNGRSLPLQGIAGVIGPLLTVLPRRLFYSPESTLADMVRQISAQMSEVLPHANLTLADIQKCSSLGPGFLTQVFNYRPAVRTPEGIQIKKIDDKSRAEGFPLAVNWEKSDNLFTLDFIYDKAVFDSYTVKSLAEAYLHFLNTIFQDIPRLAAKEQLRRFSLCSDEEVRKLVTVRNAPAVNYPIRTVVDDFNSLAGRFEESPAVITREKRKTCRELDEESFYLAVRLYEIFQKSRLKSRMSFRAALLLPRDVNYPAAVWGVLRSGASFVPLELGAPLERLLFQLDQTGASAAIVNKSQFPLWAELSRKRPALQILDLESSLSRPPDYPNELQGRKLPPVRPSDEAYILFTSGTTGQPKGVSVPHRAIYNHNRWFGDLMDAQPSEVHSAYAAWTFDVSVMEILLPLSRGSAIYIFDESERFEPGLISQAVRNNSIKHLWLPPQVGQTYMANYSLRGLKTLSLGGGVFPLPFKVFDQGDCRLINGYGPTECAVTVTANSAGPGSWPTNIGAPGANCPIYVLDPYAMMVPLGFAGELAVGGVQVASGYLPPDPNDPLVCLDPGADPDSSDGSENIKGTPPFLPDKFFHYRNGQSGLYPLYRTGDLVRRLPDGAYEFLGRLDRQIKIRGRRLEVSEIEKVIAGSPKVTENTVIKWTENTKEKLIAYVVFHPAGSDGSAELKKELGLKLPSWMIPDYVMAVPRIPKTASGKPNLTALPKPVLVSVFQAPETAEEKILVAVIREVLGDDSPISLEDDFLALGGDSVKAIMAVALLEKRGYKLPARALYDEATLRALAASLKPVPGSGRDKAAFEAGSPGGFRPACSGRSDDSDRGVSFSDSAVSEAAEGFQALESSVFSSGFRPETAPGLINPDGHKDPPAAGALESGLKAQSSFLSGRNSQVLANPSDQSDPVSQAAAADLLSQEDLFSIRVTESLPAGPAAEHSAYAVSIDTKGLGVNFPAPASSVSGLKRPDRSDHQASLRFRPKTSELNIILSQYPKDQVVAVHALTAMQEAMLLARDGDAYWIKNAASLNGPLSAEKLRDSWENLAASYEILRSAVVSLGLSRPYMVVLKERKLPFEYQDLSSLAPEAQDSLISLAPAFQPDLTKDPLMALKVYKTAQDRHWLVLFWHHVILDGWSMSRILGNLLGKSCLEPPAGSPEDQVSLKSGAVTGAANEVNGTGVNDEPPVRPFRDYLSWLERQPHSSARAFWSQELQSAEMAATVPNPLGGDGVRDPEPVTLALGAELSDLLRALGKSERLTLNVILQTALGIVLCRCNGLSCQVFCGLDSGRSGLPSELADVVGPCVNQVPVRIDYDPQSSFVGLAKKVLAFNLKAVEYGFLPLAEIRTLTGLDLGGLLFALENQPDYQLRGRYELTRIFSQSRDDLGLVFEWFQGRNLTLKLHYDGLKFSQRQIEDLAEFYRVSLSFISRSPHDPVGGLDILTPEEKDRVIDLCFGAKTDFPDELRALGLSSPKSFIEIFMKRARLDPGSPALIENGRTVLTYGELDNLSLALAGRFRSMGAGPGSVVGLNLPRGLNYAAAVLGVLRAGAAFLPLDVSWPEERLAFAVKDSRAKVIVSQFSSAPLWAGELAHFTFEFRKFSSEARKTEDGFREMTVQAGERSGRIPAYDPEEAAYVIYTSGSTGQPKGVVVKNQGLVNMALCSLGFFDFKLKKRFSLYAPVAFDASVFEIVLGLVSGSALISVPEEIRLDPPKLSQFYADNLIYFAFLPPLVGVEVIKVIQEKSSLEILALAGDKPGRLSPGGNGLKIYNLYGPTEFTVWSSGYLIDRPLNSPPIGRSLANCQSLILDKDLNLQPPGLVGELCLSGPQLAKGYLNRPQSEAGVFRPNPYSRGLKGFERLYRTGDLALYDYQGQINFLNRRDFQIKIRGQRLEPGEVERQILADEEVAAVLVGLSPRLGDSAGSSADETDQAYLVGWVVPKIYPAEPSLESRIRTRLTGALPAWMRPGFYVFLEKFPQDRHGKISVKDLPAPEFPKTGTGSPKGGNGELPGSFPQDPNSAGPNSDGQLSPAAALISEVSRVFSRVLGFWPEEDDHFLEIGGDSIKAMMGVSQLRSLGYDISTNEFLSAPTPKAVAGILSAKPPKSLKPSESPGSASFRSADSGEPGRPGLHKAGQYARELALARAHFGLGTVEDLLPLGPLQAGLWFHLALEPEAPVYVEQTLSKLNGVLSEELIAAAVRNIVRRHQALRTVFWAPASHSPESGQPWQVILKDLPPSVTGLKNADLQVSGSLARAERQALSGPRVLAGGPLFRLVINEKAGRTEILLTFHHLILDGWSVGLFYEEMLGALSHQDFRPSSGLPYSECLKALMAEREKSGPHLKFWGERLNYDPPGPWPLIRGAAPEPDGSGELKAYKEIGLALQDLARDLFDLARSQRVSPATLIQVIWGLLLQKYRGGAGSWFGLVVSGRETIPASLGTLGLFVNTVPRYLPLSLKAAFAEVLAQTQAEAGAVGEHACLTLSEALKAAGHNGPAASIIDHLLVIENLPKIQAAENLEIAFESGFNYPGYDLNAVFFLSEELSAPDSPADNAGADFCLDGHIKFRADVFRPDDIQTLTGHFRYLCLQAVSSRGRMSVGDFKLNRPEEEDDIIRAGFGEELAVPYGLIFGSRKAGGDSSVPWPVPVCLAGPKPSASESAAEPLTENSLAIVWPGGRMSYSGLLGKAGNLTADFKAKGLGPGALVALTLPPGPALVISLLAVLHSGAAYLPIDLKWPQGRIETILRSAQPALVISASDSPNPVPPFQEVPEAPGAGTPDSLSDRFSVKGLSLSSLTVDSLGTPVSFIPGASFKGAVSSGCPDLTDGTASAVPADTAYVIYTSGSTGEPKGVMVGRGSLAALVAGLVKDYGLTSQDRSMVTFSPGFDAFAWGVYLLLAVGGQVHFPPRDILTDASRLRDYMAENSVTVANMPTVLAEAIQRLEPPQSLRLLTCGGDRLSFYQKRPYAFYNEYGPTEATVLVTKHLVTETAAPIPIGRPIPGVQTLILGPHDEIRPFNMAGELVLSGPCLALGYLRREDLTQASFAENPCALKAGALREPRPSPNFDPSSYQTIYRTGDLARMGPDGLIEFIGRIDSQASIGGIRVEPAEVEARIKDNPQVDRALVLARKDAAGDSFLAAYITAGAARGANSESLGSGEALIKTVTDHLSAHLPTAFRPKFICLLDRFPLTANGKIDYLALPAAGNAPVGSADPEKTGLPESYKPRSAVEASVLEAYREILGAADADGIDPEADFFSLGGDSLKAVRLAARLETVLKAAPKVSELIGGFSLKKLCESVEGRKAGRKEILSPLRLGAGPALIIVPTVGGSLWAYREFYRRLPQDRSLYALDPNWESAVSAVEAVNGADKLAALVRPYAEAVLELRAEVVLCGLCLAGLTAWELGRQLLDRGAQVRSLLFFNARTRLLTEGEPVKEGDSPPEAMAEELLSSMRLYEGAEKFPDRPENFINMSFPEHLRRYASAQLSAWGFYRPQPMDVKLTCLRPLDSFGPKYLPFETGPLGWEELALQGYREVRTPGHHYDLLRLPAVNTAVTVAGELTAEKTSRPAVPLTPIQKWYFELGPKAWPMFQSVGLVSQVARPPWVYLLVLEDLLKTHPMLRASFPENDGGAEARITSDFTAFTFEISADRNLEGLTERFGQIARKYLQNADPLVIFLLGRTDQGQDCFLLAVHHLVVDNVSWRVLESDFKRSLSALDGQGVLDYDRAKNGLARLPKPEASGSVFRIYAQKLSSLALDNDFLAAEAAYWGGALEAMGPPLPSLAETLRKAPEFRGLRVSKTPEKASLQFELNSSDTELFLTALGPEFGAREMLLTSLLLSAAEGFGVKELTFCLEGHGRTPVFPEADLASAVGWFTVLYPVRLSLGSTPLDTLKIAAEKLRAVPHNGIGYGVLKYLAGQNNPGCPPGCSGPGAELPKLPWLKRPADVLFNYLSEINSGAEETSSISIERLGSPYDSPVTFPAQGSLSVSAFIDRGALKSTWIWSEAINIDLLSWAAGFQASLLGLGRILKGV
ncbi:MAG: amino acid adenylation domain-containing protein [Deltaproteobacteria bacterium]|jgi:amino acid adenylation domain-containing protein|nr:amino acid adenylation domain-containing protein [Deltaproteobacteria bacterium]